MICHTQQCFLVIQLPTWAESVQSSCPLIVMSITGCQGNPKVLYYHLSAAWRKLPPLLDHQSLVSTLKPYLHLHSFNQGERLDADWRSDVALTAGQIGKKKLKNRRVIARRMEGEIQKNTVKLTVQHSGWWTVDKTNTAEFSNGADDNAKIGTLLLHHPQGAIKQEHSW